MAKTMVRYEGLQRRQTYDEILGYLERGGGPGIDIAFPNRQASFIRNSPQYQNMLTLDFVDLQQQQENMLKQQKRDIIVKEQSSNSSSSMKSVLASETPSESAASQQVESDFTAISKHSDSQDLWNELDDELTEMRELAKIEKDNEMAARGKAGMVSYVDNVTTLSDALRAAQATGHEPFVGTTGDKFKDKHIRDGQGLNLLRVVEGNNPPPYISEISKTNPQAVEALRERHGLKDPQSQAAFGTGSASSSGPANFNIATPRSKSLGAKPRNRQTLRSGASTGETQEPGRSSSVAATGETSEQSKTLNKDGTERKKRGPNKPKTGTK
jgi:hypothetical protein